ncbi:alpha/beta hydrolase [Butyrivibrio proteoclasticus]|uniref:alpha/beta hydrolase n=1 Tax=Butyrivibrio proteoclasticus TaxID=43305 RepID=UPI00047E5992|nr:alpha/beta hydrolase [Butyrivibrio proteoclasticus]
MNSFIYYFSRMIQRKADPILNSITPVIRDDIEAKLNLEYQGDDGNTLKVDVYRGKKHAESGAKLPVMIMVHGGGLYTGNQTIEYNLCQLMAIRGFLVFSISYRLMTDATLMQEIADVAAGFRYVDKHLDNFNGDRGRVNVVAESAGAYLSIYTVAMHRSQALWEKINCRTSTLNVRRMACFSGMYYTDKFDLIGMLYPQQIFKDMRKDKEFMKMMNPEHPEIINNLPPMHLTSSDADFLGKYTLSFADALKKAGIKCKVMFYRGNKELTHAFPAQKSFLPESIEVIDDVTRFFQED